jgi:hypothetical protein
MQLVVSNGKFYRKDCHVNSNVVDGLLEFYWRCRRELLDDAGLSPSTRNAFAMLGRMSRLRQVRLA